LDKINHHHSKLWALPKIYSYSQQNKPFLHIDGDVFIWKAFDEKFLESELITQNLEVSTDYYERHMIALEAELVFFPKEIIEARKKYYPIYAYNAGIFGGNDLSFFENYTNIAFNFINANEKSFSKIDVGVFNIFFEQYLFYALVKDGKKDVAVLIDEVIGDNQYTGFGEFCEVPHNKQYLHLLGTFKRDKTVCEQMANRLRLDYPEYYYRIISLFKQNKISLKNDRYYFFEESAEKDLVERYKLLKEGFSKNSLPCHSPVKQITFVKTNLSEAVLQRISHSFIKDMNLNSKVKEDINQFEQILESLLSEKFVSYSQEYLYARDLNCTTYIQQIFTDPETGFNSILEIEPMLEIIDCMYNWHEVYHSYVHDNYKKAVLDDGQSIRHIAIIPECNKTGYSLIDIDDLDLYILDLLEKPISVRTLVEEIKVSFDPEDLRNALAEFETLIYGRIKNAIQSKIIKVLIN